MLQIRDCSAAVVRSGRMIFLTESLLLGYNIPSVFDPRRPLDPCRANLYSIPIQTGDIVICASDGIFDNVWPCQIEKMVESADELLSFAIKTALIKKMQTYHFTRDSLIKVAERLMT